MSKLLERLNIIRWPMWAKFAFGFGIAILVPVMILAALAISGVREIGTENLKTYALEVGSRQRQAVTDAFSQALEAFSTYVTDPEYRQALVAAQVSSRPSLSGVGITRDLDRLLLSAPNQLFENIWLLNTAGRLVAVSTAPQRPEDGLVVGANLATSEAFSVARRVEALGSDQDIAVYLRDGQPFVEIIHAVRSSEDTVVGFLVGRIKVAQAIISSLQFQDSALPTYSYLLDSASGLVIAPEEALERAQFSAGYGGALRALNGERGIDVYTIGEDAAAHEVVGFFTALQVLGQGDQRFILVTEIDLSAPAQRLVAYASRLSFPVVIGILALTVILILLFTQLFLPPVTQLLQGIRALGSGTYDIPIPAAGRGDELGAVSAAFVDTREQVRNLIAELSVRMEERVRDVQATQEISRVAATERDLQRLMDNVVQLIVQRFPTIYHAQIFLLDDEQNVAVLRASTGEPGRKLLERGHRLSVGSNSVIGQVTQEGRVIVARDTLVSEVHRKNEFLPDTRAELAIPLRVGERIIGALDVQSRRSNAFDQELSNVLQTMADQVAIAIQNARLYQESLRRLEEINQANRLATRRAWEEYMTSQRTGELSTAAGQVASSDYADLRSEAIAQGKPVVGEVTAQHTVPVAVPIVLRGQPLGAVQWELPQEDFNFNKVLLAQELVSRLAVSLENARLFQESRQAIERERTVNAIATRLTQQTDINEILQTAVREVGQALRAPQTVIRLHWAQQPNGEHSTNGHDGPQSPKLQEGE